MDEGVVDSSCILWLLVFGDFVISGYNKLESVWICKGLEFRFEIELDLDMEEG